MLSRSTWFGAKITLCALALSVSLGAPRVIAADDDDGGDQEEATETNTGSVPKARSRDHVDEKNPANREAAPITNSRVVRRFHAVLDELLAEFAYDVKMGQIKGLSNIAIRKVRVSNAIPRSYEEYLETLMVERIRENSQVRVIDCIPCKTKTSSLVDGKLMITSPATNVAKLDAAATSLGIENFMDVILVYHTTHMVLAVNVFNSQSKETVWARSYNSETLKTRFQKMAVDFSQVEPKKITEEYVPEFRLMIGLGGASIPNISGRAADAAMLNLQIRSTEKFNNRHNEVGLLLSINYSAAKLVGTSSTQTATTTNADGSKTTLPTAFRSAVGLYAFFSYLFLGQIESYNEIRTGIGLGLGTVIAPGYLAPAARTGVDFFLGRHFSLSFYGNYLGAASVNINGSATSVKGGPGGDAVFSVNF